MNENLYFKNLSSFKAEDNEYLNYFKESLYLDYKEEIDYEVGVEVIEGRKILYVVNNEKSFQLDSLYDSNQVIDRWYEQIENINYRSRFIMFGFGNGMYINKLLKETEIESEIIVIEPSVNIFVKVLHEFDISNILKCKNVHLIISGIGNKRLRDILEEHLKYEDLLGAVRRSYINYSNLFKGAYKEFLDVIDFHVDLINANETLITRMGEHYLLNSLSNYLYIKEAKSLIDLNKKIPKDIPAILVSAGPSLDKNIKELRKAKNKSFILSVDTAAVALVENGVIPDMLISIDAMKSYKHFENPLVQKIPLVCYLHSNCSSLELHQGDKYFLQNNNDYIKQFFDKIGKVAPEIEGGGSVANSAFAFLERMGFKTIILVGQDLAYTNGRSHAVATVTGKEKMDVSDKSLSYVDDIDGNPVLISREFQIYLDWFVEEIKAHKQYRVIDATEGGAKIKGAEIQDLKYTVATECVKETNIDEIMKSIVSRFDENEKKEYILYMEELPSQICVIKGWIEETIKIYNNMLKNMSSSKINVNGIKKNFARTCVLVEKIENNPAYYYLHCGVQKELMKFRENDIYGNENNNMQDMKNSVKQALEYMTILNNQIEYCNMLIVSWLKKVYYKDQKRKTLMIDQFK